MGKNPDQAIGRTKAEQDAKTNEILENHNLSSEYKLLARSEKQILNINIHDVDGFVIFPYCLDRFSSLLQLADSGGKPIVIVNEENRFSGALETYQYLADRGNVELVSSPRQVKARIEAMKPRKLFETVKICLFDAGEWKVDGVAWQGNPLFSDKLNVEKIDVEKFYRNIKRVKSADTETLAKRWMKGVRVLEPSFNDVAKAARVYLAMKKTMLDMKANAAYVLWCGQFTKKLKAKMCFALAKLADDGYPTGCWRGENLLPLLILHAVSSKPVFVSEAFTHARNTITLRHCFAPTKLSKGKYVLRRWRNMEGTVTGYCQLLKGQVTLVNCGIGDRMVVTKGKVIECKDLGGENCRMTVWIQMEKPELISKFVAREFAMVYGDFEKEVAKVGQRLGLRIIR